MASPTQRTLSHLRDAGWHVGVVERWIPQARKRVDLFGMVDLVGLAPGTAPHHYILVGLQVTSASNHASRIAKLQDAPALEPWLASGACLLVASQRIPANDRAYHHRYTVLEHPDYHSATAHLLAQRLSQLPRATAELTPALP